MQSLDSMTCITINDFLLIIYKLLLNTELLVVIFHFCLTVYGQSTVDIVIFYLKSIRR